MIYIDNCATTKISDEVLDVMLPYMTTMYGNASQLYSFGKKSRKAIEEAREIIAKCINADSSEIYFTSCGTESNNWVIKNTKGNIITSNIEHHAILNSLKDIEKNNRKYYLLDTDNHGIININEADKYIDGLGLVSIMMVNNEIGTIEPIERCAIFAHKHNAYFHTDAVQAVGHIPIDVKNMNIDFLSASAHKFHGPKGIGFLYCKKDIYIESYINGGMQENKKRAGTENVACIVGMAKALEIANKNIESRKKYLCELENIFLQKLKNEKLDFICNSHTNHNPGVLSISFKNVKGEMIMHRLDLKGICVSTGSACDSKNTDVSHVLKAIRVPQEYIYGTIRFSFGEDNTRDEIDIVVDELKKILRSN